jgi:hypothetical protein
LFTLWAHDRGVYEFTLRLRRLFDAHWRAWAGVAFVAAALLAIGYDEVIAPGMDRASGAWAASELGRKLASLSA